MAFNDIIRQISNGEPVDAGVPNRVTRLLDENIRHLKQLIDASEIGSAIFARDVLVDPEVDIGQPVFYDPNLGGYRRALAGVETSENGDQVLTAQSQPWGLVYKKHSSVSADLLISGYAKLNINDAIQPGESLTPGMYYLSGKVQGTVTKSTPGLQVPVLRTTSQGDVFFAPQWSNFASGHQHYVFDLTCNPSDSDYIQASSPNSVLVNIADQSRKGWLPSGHSAFDGKAPSGAKFGYNLSQHEPLYRAWPPLPASRAYVEWDRGDGLEKGFQGVSANQVVVDHNGIWWMSDCYDDAPWPMDFDSNDPDPDMTFSACPRPLPMRMRIWFTKPMYISDTTAVTDLMSVDDRLLVQCQDSGEPASKGALQLKLDTDFLVGDADKEGHVVFKDYNEATRRFDSGPVLEGVIAGTNNVIIDSSSSRVLSDVPGSPTLHQGIVTMSVDATGSLEVPVGLVRLNGVSEETYQDVMYLGMPAGVHSSCRMMVQISETLGVSSPELTLNLVLLGRVIGTLPSLTVTSRRLPAYDGTPVSLPTFDTSVTINTAVVHSQANQYSLVKSDPLPVLPGDTYLFTVSRSDGAGYADEVGILRQSVVISSNV